MYAILYICFFNFNTVQYLQCVQIEPCLCCVVGRSSISLRYVQYITQYLCIFYFTQYRICRSFRGLKNISRGKIFVIQSTHENLSSTEILMLLNRSGCGRGIQECSWSTRRCSTCNSYTMPTRDLS